MALQSSNGANYARFGTNARICSGRSFTIEAWINASSFPADGGDGGGFNVILGGQSSAPAGWDFGYQSYNSTLYLGWTPDGTNYYGYGVPGLGDGVAVPIATGRWVHVAAVFMAEVLRYALYVDGRAAALSPAFAAGPGSATAALGLRQSYDNAGFSYTGALARVRMYEGALGGRAIERSMRSPVVPADLRSRVLADVPLRREPTLIVRDEGPASLGIATQTGTVTQAADPDTAPLLRRLRAVKAAGSTAYTRTISSSASHSSAAARATAAARLTAASIAHSAAIARAQAAQRALDSALVHSAVVTARADRARVVSETIAHSAALERAATATRPLSATIAHAATLSAASARARGVASSIAQSAALTRAQGLARTLVSTIGHAVTLERAQGLTRALAAAVAQSAAMERATALARELVSGIAHSALVEGIKAGPGAFTRTITSSIAHVADLARQTAAGRVLGAGVDHVAQLTRQTAVARELASGIDQAAVLERAQGLVRGVSTSTAHAASLGRLTSAGRGLASAIAHASSLARASILGRAISWARDILVTIAQGLGVIVPPTEGSMRIPDAAGELELPGVSGSLGLPAASGTMEER